MQVLTFYVRNTLFAVNVLHVKEINDHTVYTEVPKSHKFIKGLLNFRGQIITIFDLSIMLNKDETITGKKSKNLIFKNEQETIQLPPEYRLEDVGNDTVGIIVDKIGDVMEMEITKMQQPPGNVDKISKKYIQGVFQLKDDLMIVLNVNELIKV